MTEAHLILGIGELLWDILPEGPRRSGVSIDGSLSMEPLNGVALEGGSQRALLGGAPANFAVMAGRLGDHAVILSRIGRDELGRLAMDKLDPLPVDSRWLQVDPTHETGRVTVGFVGDEPRYTIHQPAAWDFLDCTDEWVQLAERADAICFGSLAQRSPDSRQTIQSLVAQTPASCIRVFDVNLRTPFYSGEVIQESLEMATVVKMNEQETPQVLRLLGMPVDWEPAPDQPQPNQPQPNQPQPNQPLTDQPQPAGEEPGHPVNELRASAERLLDEFSALQMVAITRGRSGSLLVTREEWNAHAGFPVKVADCIGAGDAFTVAITHYMLRGADLATLNEAGNRWGGWVASQPGAMPALPEAVRGAIAAAIEG